ncbi:ZP3 protein, partial [Polyodon spathula]|nr:ZP3 protein [Polyodon spathula]
MVVFQYGLLDCCFMRMVTANITSYMNVLTYKPTQSGFYQSPFNQAVVCTYTKPAGWTPPVYNPALGDASGFGKLEFTMGIMNDDFSAPRTSSLFFLGSLINIAAAVKQQFHMPLMVYIEACVAASTPELSPSSQTYPLITNRGWKLLDNPGLSSVCSCCNSNCNMRKRRDTAEEGLTHTAVLGPLRILPEELSAGSWEFHQRSPAQSLEEPQQAVAWLPVLAAPLLLMALLGTLSLGYYMCVWRHPRLCSKSSRELFIPAPIDGMHTAVYIHCRLLAWDPAQLNDPTKKACSFNQRTRSWKLLDNPGLSSVCSCCNSNCNMRKRRDTAEEGLTHTAVLGPLRILPEELSAGSWEFHQRSPALSLEEPQQAVAWLPVLAAPLLLMALLGTLSLGYYMCVWRHPRLCSKSSRELFIPAPIDGMHTAVGTVSSMLAQQF